MKKILHAIGLLFCSVSLAIVPFTTIQARTAVGFSEKIESFTSDVTVQPNGDVRVVETIQYDFGENEKHGMYRTIPLGFTPRGQFRHTEITVDSVVDDTKRDYEYDITSKDPVNIKIGDPDVFVTGQKTYIISYTVHHEIGYFDDYDEVYWNITGDAWKVPIEQVKATITLPKRIAASELKMAQYCGAAGQQEQCGTFITGKDGSIVFEMSSDRFLKPFEQVTVGIGFPKGLVSVPSVQDLVWYYVTQLWFLPLPFLIALFWFRKRIVFWKNHRAYYRKNTIIAEYDAGGFDPLEASILVNGKAKNSDISALIVSLAIRGYLKIENKDDEFVFHQLKEADPEGKPYERTLLKQLDDKHESDLDRGFGVCAGKAIKTAETSLLARDYLTKSGAFHGQEKVVSVMLGFFLALNPGLFIWVLVGKAAGFAFSGACVLIAIVGLFLKPRSVYLVEKGFEAERKLLGLKLYLEVAEVDRIKFANAPAKTPELFEKLLPYAMIFHLEEKWAKEFEGIYVDPPTWYVGSTAAFSSMVFVHSFSSMNAVASQAIASSVPSSSRSSWGGSSGSSGGGSSGGGGGGGGGGSW